MLDCAVRIESQYMPDFHARVLDHFIVGDDGGYLFTEHGLL